MREYWISRNAIAHAHIMILHEKTTSYDNATPHRRSLGVLESISLYNIIYHRYLYYIHTHRDNKILYYINNLKSILYNTGGAYIPPRISKIGHFNGVVPLVIEWTSLFYNQWLDLSNSNSVIIP